MFFCSGVSPVGRNRKDIPSIAKAANGSIVSIVMSDKDGKPLGQGSRFFVSKDGLIVTNYHVIAEGVSGVAKLPDGAFYLIDGVLASDKVRDVAVLKAQGHNFRTLTLGNSDRVQVGEEVVAIGSPLSLESTVSNGIVSGIRAVKEEGGKYLQITAPVSPGSSGGPLFNTAGEVVGITTMYLKGGENLNFAIPINDAKRLLLAKSSKLQSLPNETDLVKAQTNDGDAPASGSGPSRQPSTDRYYYQHLYDAGGFFIPGFKRLNGTRTASTDYVCFSDDQHSGRFFTFKAQYYDDNYINALKKWFEYAGADSGTLEELHKKAEGMKSQWDIMHLTCSLIWTTTQSSKNYYQTAEDICSQMPTRRVSRSIGLYITGVATRGLTRFFPTRSLTPRHLKYFDSPSNRRQCAMSSL